jgi:hypothetical protein
MAASSRNRRPFRSFPFPCDQTGVIMAKTAKKRTGRGRKQDRARVAGGQDYEVRYEAKKTTRSSGAVKNAVKKVGNSRKRVEQRL